MDLGLAFSFPFQDEKWVQKILIAGLVMLIPIVGWLAVFGWSVEIARRVVRQSPDPLPDWVDFSNYIFLGLKASAIVTIYILPIFLLAILVVIIQVIGSDIGGVVALIVIGFSCFSIIYSVLLAVFLLPSFGILAETDSIGESANPGNNLEILRAAPAAFFVAIVGILIASFVSGLGVFACFVGLLFTVPYALAIQGHLVGQAYVEALSAT